MATKVQTYAQLAEDTAKRLTNSLEAWTGFLTTVGRLYRYNYHEQLMIYAQRPDATACAEYDLWNNKMNRYVRRGSKGIALLDPTGDTLKLRYVFDVSDTGTRENSRFPYLWDMQEYHKEPILEMLKDKFDVRDNNLSDAFHNIARNMSSEYYDNNKGDIHYLIENSFFDLAIGNVLFGNYKFSEKKYDNLNFLIHDHFFTKTLDKVRPGGVVAFITSKRTMDKQSSDIRRYLAQRAELLGAIRLPNNAFLKNAGTEVTSDIIFLQKRDRPIDVDRD